MLGKKKRQPATAPGPVYFDFSRPFVSTGEAAAIMGFSRWTMLRRIRRWNYRKIRRCLLSKGWVFDMEDVIRAAYPTADDAQITMLMKNYREKFLQARQRKSPKSRDISDFISQLRKAFEADGGHVVIYRKTDAEENPSLVAEITLAKALEGRVRLEGALLDELGDGVYTIGIHSKDKGVLGQYEFAVGSPPKTDTGKADDVPRDPWQALIDGQERVMEALLNAAQYDDEYDDEYDE